MLEDFIRANGLSARVFFVPGKAGSAEHASKFIKSSLPIVKSIVLMGSSGTPLLVILLGEDKIDFKKIKDAINASDVRLASPQEVFEITGYEIGGVPPISIYGVRALIDRKVAALDEVVCGGGTPEHLMQIKVKEIMENAEEIRVVDAAK